MIGRLFGQFQHPTPALAPTLDEVVAHVLAHHDRQRAEQAKPPVPPLPGYHPEVLAALLGTSTAGGESR